MFKRQPLVAVASARPRCPVSMRVQSVRFRSDILPANRQRGQEKGSNTMPTNPAPEHKPTQHNQPATGRSRQQRAAQVSEEVRMLNRGSTAATVPGNNSPYPSTQSKGIDPEVLGGQGQMGDNDSVFREGPTRQSPGRVLRSGQSNQVQSEHSPKGRARGPENGGATLLDNARNEELQQGGQDDGLENMPDPTGNSTVNELVLLEQFDKQDITPVAFSPEAVTKDEYLKLGQNGATIAGGNFEGVIEDRIKQVAEATQDEFRYVPDIAARLVKGELVSFKDEAEKSAVLAAVKEADFEFAPIGSGSQTTFFDKFVRGAYPDANAAPHRQKILNEVHRTIARNSSYLNKDSAKLMRKIGSLLPSEAAARKPSPRAAKK